MADDDMGNFTEDARTKLTVDEHARLAMVSIASGEEIAAILRRLVHDFLDTKEREYTIAARFAKAKGIEREAPGNAS